MLNFTAFKGHLQVAWPAWCSFAGAALLLGAWPFTTWDGFHYSNILFGSAVILWVALPLLFIGMYVRPAAPSRMTLRVTVLFAVFATVMTTFIGDSSTVLLGKMYREISAQSLSMGGFFLLVLGLASWEKPYPWLARLGDVLRLQENIHPARFVLWGFAVFLSLTIFLSWSLFNFAPSYNDSAAQYIHGKFVASGHLYYIPGHPLHDFFPAWMMLHHNDKWYSQYPPLHQTLLGLGHMIGAPWLINPLEGALTLVVMYAATKRAYGENTARLASVLMFLSPFIVIMSSEFMNHSSALLFTTLLIYTYGELQAVMGRTDKRFANGWALAVGLSSGCIFLTRPWVAVGVSMPFIVHALWRLRADRKANAIPSLWMAAGGMVCVLCQLWYNHETTGEFFTYAYAVYHENSFIKSFGTREIPGTPNPTHVSDYLIGSLTKMREQWYLMGLNLFEWSIPCVCFVILPCVMPVKNLMTKLLLGIVVSETLFDMCNLFHNYMFGPRYFYEISTALIILTAVGITQLPALLKLLNTRPVSLKTEQEPWQGMATLVMLMVFATGLLYRYPDKLKEYTHYFDSHPDFNQAVLAKTQHPALIFLGRTDNDKPPLNNTFCWTVWTNPPDDNAPVIYALDRGDTRNRALMDYYPTRNAYIESGEKLTPVAPMIFNSQKK